MADSSQTTYNDASTDGMIRNLNQTVQEREIIKTCPDLIVYLDGKTYLLNPYITNTTQGQPYTFVSFNDYVQNFSASYDVDNLVPSGNFTLQVPNHAKYLFQTPGGNNLIESMMEVQIFAKGYFASSNGNTIYHRVFKGLSSHVAHTDTGMFLEISVQCLGVLHLLEYMYIDQAPALLSNSERLVQPYATNQANMNPYEALADTFLRGITFEGFQLNAIQQTGVSGVSQQWAEAVKVGYCNKWQPIIENIRKEVHITGYRPGSVLPQDINGFTQTYQDADGDTTPNLQTARDTQHALLAQNVSNPDYYVDVIRGYLPDMNIGQIQLTNGRVTSRLERIRTIVQLIGYEGFQDLDGTVIFKPPLYNLDVTNIRGTMAAQSAAITGTGALNDTQITDNTNPFVVHLSEIETESEAEDQQAIKATRVTVQPSLLPNLPMIPDAGTALLRPVIQHIDIPKMARFGLREEIARTVTWLGLQDKVACYTYAVSELNRANRGWRTYNLTIPLRPELRLGFPMYLPHKDMYGYIKTISISYSQGGAATMSIMLDTLRKRPVFPAVKTTGQNQTIYTNPPVVYTTQPNLVMQWTEPPSTTNSQTSIFSSSPSSITNDGFPSASSNANLLNIPATQLQPDAKPIYSNDMAVISARQSQYGTSFGTKADTRTKSFRVQNDVATADDAAQTSTGAGSTGQSTSSTTPTQTFSPTVITQGKPFFSATNWGPGTRGVDVRYLQKIIGTQPYTDEGGYELITPFPWGRWKSLVEAERETHRGVLVLHSTSDETQSITDTKQTFLFAGVGSPNAVDSSSTLQSQLNSLANVSNLVASSTSFEIETPKPGDKQANILNNMQPDSLLITQSELTTDSNVLTFLTGNTPPQSGSSLSLASQLVSTIQNNPNVVGTTTSTPQAQAFVFSTIQNNPSVVGTTAESAPSAITDK
jgi:hypothetical protein